MKEKVPVVKQLYRLSIEPRVVDQLAKLATRLSTEAVMGFKPAGKTKNGAKT